jgi:hypothetical protein
MRERLHRIAIIGMLVTAVLGASLPKHAILFIIQTHPIPRSHIEES